MHQFARQPVHRRALRKPKPTEIGEGTDEILGLQKTAGNRAVTSLLAPPAPSPSVVAVQRKELNGGEIVAALDTIPFIKERLDAALDMGARKSDVLKTPKNLPLDIRKSVTEVLAQYETNLKGTDKTKNHAMMIASVLEAVAKVIAVDDLNDPALTPVLSVKLLELYRPEITGALGKMDDAGDALALTEALVGDDPVGLYMHKELHIDEAARRVRQMAFAAGKKSDEMMEMLRQRFEMQMGSLSKTDVKAREDESTEYNLKESTGMVSSAYFEKLFGDKVDKAKWKSGAKGGKQLDFTPEQQKRLTDLEAAVTAKATAKSTTVRERAGLTFKQSKHLDEVESAEAAMDMPAKRAEVDARLAAMLGVDAAMAKSIRQQVEANLNDLPITLTVGGMGWFGKRAPRRKHGEAQYKAGAARREVKKFSQLFAKPKAKGEIAGLGQYKDPADSKQKRGKDYLRFRNWKDRAIMGSGLGFSDTELPTFAAANVNWAAHGSMPDDQKPGQAKYAHNPYGDTHFVLNRRAIADRMVYTATDHGFPRRDVFLAFADFVLGNGSITGLKDTARPGVVGHVINSLILQKPALSALQQFEVQIFGRVDIDKDVEKIVVAPTVDEVTRKNIEKFAKKTGIPVEFAVPQQVVGPSWTVPNGLVSQGSLVDEVQQKLAKMQQDLAKASSG